MYIWYYNFRFLAQTYLATTHHPLYRSTNFMDNTGYGDSAGMATDRIIKRWSNAIGRSNRYIKVFAGEITRCYT